MIKYNVFNDYSMKLCKHIMKMNGKSISHKDLKTCRYLLKFSYLGTNYTGLQRQANRDVVDVMSITDQSIQYQIETSLFLPKKAIERQLRPIYGARLAVSSRTDSGVHAIVNTAHVDLTHPYPNTVYKPSFITQSVNAYLSRNDHEIRLLNTQMVGNGFNSRGAAKWRQYLYRLAVLDSETDPSTKCIDSLLPIWELNKCHIIKGPVNAEEMLRVVDLFKGDHDFASFTPKLVGEKQIVNNTNKTIIEFNVSQSKSLDSSIHTSNQTIPQISLWSFEIKSKSFLYNQVRRMIGCIIDVGLNRFKYNHIEWLLNNPCPKNWKFSQTVAPANGLWLSDIHYDQSDVQLCDDLGDKTNEFANSYPNYSEISHFTDN